jgi:hypothetical protein
MIPMVTDPSRRRDFPVLRAISPHRVLIGHEALIPVPGLKERRGSVSGCLGTGLTPKSRPWAVSGRLRGGPAPGNPRNS